MLLSDEIRILFDLPDGNQLEVTPLNDEFRVSIYEDTFYFAKRRKIDTEIIISNLGKIGNIDVSPFNILEKFARQAGCITINVTIIPISSPTNSIKCLYDTKSGEYDYNSCTIKTALTVVDSFQCLDSIRKKEVNLLDITNKVELGSNIGQIEETKELSQTYNNFPIGNIETIIYPSLPSPQGYGWVLVNAKVDSFDHQQNADFLYSFDVVSTWKRLCRTEDLTDAGWVEENGKWYTFVTTDGGKIDYVQRLGVNQSSASFHYVDLPEYTATLTAIQIQNGVYLKDILEFYIKDCQGLNIKSTFFNINPTNTYDLPEYDYSERYLHELVYAQSSEIILASAENAATRYSIKFEDFWEDLKSMYDVVMIEDSATNTISIEHKAVLEFNRKINLLDSNLDDNILKYHKDFFTFIFDKEEAFYRQEYRFVFNTNDTDFDGAYTEYDFNCSNKRTQTIITKVTATNIALLLNNKELGKDLTRLAETQIAIATKAGQIMQATGAFSARTKLNAPLAFPNLIENLHLRDRPFLEGIMNGNKYTFLSETKNRKMDITSMICPSNYFSQIKGNELVNTNFGWCQIQSLDYVLPQAVVDYKLKF